jgi:hypothetical protein
VLVYYHDGKSYSGVANFVFLKLLDWYLSLDDTPVCSPNQYHLYIYYKWNKMLYPKTKIKRRGIKASKNDSRNGIKMKTN